MVVERIAGIIRYEPLLARPCDFPEHRPSQRGLLGFFDVMGFEWVVFFPHCIHPALGPMLTGRRVTSH